MAGTRPPAYTELVYEVLRESPDPLTSKELLAHVQERRPVTTRDPMRTIRTALSQGWALVRVPGGRYGYLPNIIGGSVLRLPLTENKPANHPLVYPVEVHQALFPLAFEQRLRKDRSPARATLPGGEEVFLGIEHRAGTEWGAPMPEGLRRYLVSQRAAAGDSLLVRVVDATARRYEVVHEPHRKRDEATIAARDRELADAAAEVLRRARSTPLDTEMARALLAEGVYRADVPPDTIDEVLAVDPRFRRRGIIGWGYVEGMTEEELAAFDARGRLFAPVTKATTGGIVDELLGGLQARLQGLDSPGEMRAALDRIIAEGAPLRRRPRTPLDRAQDLIADAWQTEDPAKRVRMARRALAISPDCADAYLLLAAEARTLREQADLYAQGVAAGERALGPGGVEGYGGVFWGNLLTRPYMRARASLAETLWELGERDEAIGHLQGMLRLNPNDNQGQRYVILGWLLVEDRNEEAATLLDAYDEDTAFWLYGAALLAFHSEGDGPTARQALARALEANPLVPDYLLGYRPMPASLPDYWGVGDEREAQLVRYEHGEAWRTTEGALEWLARHR